MRRFEEPGELMSCDHVFVFFCWKTVMTDQEFEKLLDEESASESDDGDRKKKKKKRKRRESVILFIWSRALKMQCCFFLVSFQGNLFIKHYLC